VKALHNEEDWKDAYQKIADEIKKAREDKDRSVVVLTSGFGLQPPEQLKDDPIGWEAHAPGLDMIFALGVPIICAAGNGATAQNPLDINHRPANFLDDKVHPLINVGAVEYDGHAWARSQGRKDNKILTIYAPGVNVWVQSLRSFDNSGAQVSGTSYGESILSLTLREVFVRWITTKIRTAAPQVAGLIATYLSYDKSKQPWDGLTGIERVVAIKKYLTSDISSWERQTGVNAIWNGATEEAHKSAGANGYSNPSPQQPSPQPSPQPAPAPQKKKALSIILQKSRELNKNSYQVEEWYEWNYYATDRGVSKLCEVPKWGWSEKTNARPSADGTPPWPAGTFHMEGLFKMNCDYKNDGKGNPGALWCENMLEPIACQADPMRERDKVMKKCDANVSVMRDQHAVVFCEW